MNISARNEFEPIPCFTHIAGCSLGSWTPRETACQLIKTLETVSSYDCVRLWRDLAESSDDVQYTVDIQDEVCELLNEYAVLPDYCYIGLEDGEYRVLPDIDSAQEDCLNVEELPDSPVDSEQYQVLQVNDHGNATFYCWNEQKQEYIEVWSVV